MSDAPAAIALLDGDDVRGRVRRYELPTIGALSFVLQGAGALQGGVTTSPSLDPHGKARGPLILDPPIGMPGASAPPRLR